jgi:hypothetical protein
VARNRYGWEKRAKEIARKQKHEEKLKRRQNKGRAPEEEIPTSEAEGAGGVEPEDSGNPEVAS